MIEHVASPPSSPTEHHPAPTSRESDVMMTEITPFERDILEQPAALVRQSGYDLPSGIHELVSRAWDRIILTGMGSSHFAGIPTWRALIRRGLPAWAIDTGRLIDAPGLLTPNSLVVATSQSGESAEIVELLNRLGAGSINVGALIGITDSVASSLGRSSTLALDLRSGAEATVSTKSYLNSLGVHARVAAAFTGGDDGGVRDELRSIADAVGSVISNVNLQPIAASIVARPNRRIATIGLGDDGATALYAALIAKEASKVPVEGFIGGQFRHGPFELAGKGMTAMLFGLRSAATPESIERLANDLVTTGAEVLVVGDILVEGAETVRSPPLSALGGLATDAVVAQLFAVALARSNGVTPGSFAYGSKITTAL